MTFRKRRLAPEKTKGYYRANVTAKDFRRIMGEESLTVNQVAAMISDMLTPETKARYAEMHAKGKPQSAPLEVRMIRGTRDFVRMRLGGYYFKKMVNKNGRGREAKYQWITPKDNQAGQDSA